MAQITFIISLPGGPPATRVENVNDQELIDFLKVQFPDVDERTAAQRLIDFVFDDMSRTSVSIKRKNQVINDMFGNPRR